MDFLENKLSLNKDFKVHLSGTCAEKKKRLQHPKSQLGKMCALLSSTDIYSLSSIQPFNKKISTEINDNRFLLKIKFMKYT